MEGTNLKTRKHIINFGLLAGGVGVVFGLMLFFQELHYERGFAIQAIQFGILALFVVLGILQYKKANEGYISLKQALKIGAGVGLIAAILGTIYFFIMSNVLDPGYMDKAMELAKVETLEKNPQMTDEQWNQGVEFQKKFMPVFLAFGIVVSALFGLIVGLITGAIVKNNRPE